ncbi:hypothetical protein BGX38DRAFT_459680 [Terfezia claveryi]|nr:hypothetical protein BGX38DRAFT_459680 [Terfezia claveryi]
MVVVAIQSSYFRGKYVTLDASGLTGFAQAGAGTAGISLFVGPNETYRLINNADGTVSFACTAFTNVYLSADGRGVATPSTSAGGIVNAQFGLGLSEKFFIRRPENAGKTYNGIVGLELAAFPGRFLRLEGGSNVLNIQGVMGRLETFEIMVVGAFQSTVV